MLLIRSDLEPMDVEAPKTNGILYEDQFCRVTKKEVVVKNCNFWATEKVVRLQEIKKIEYFRQNLSENLLFRNNRSRTCRRGSLPTPLSPKSSRKHLQNSVTPNLSRKNQNPESHLPKSPSEKNPQINLYDYLWSRTPELLAYYASGPTNKNSLYSITIESSKKRIAFPIARPEVFLDLIRVLMPYQIMIQHKQASEMDQKILRMILAGSSVSQNL